MTAAEILEKLRVLDVALEVAGDKLRLSPPEAISPELVEKIRAHKPELLALLSRAELALEREAIQAEANTPISSGEPLPSRWSLLADSGLHHNDVADHAEVIFLFGIELLADPSRAREDCHSPPSLWAHYAPFWSERLPHEAFEVLEQRYRQRLSDLGLQDKPQPLQGPKALRPLELNAAGTGCAECGGRDYWVQAKGGRYCLTCHPAYLKDVIAIGALQAAEAEALRPSMRRRAGGGKATR